MKFLVVGLGSMGKRRVRCLQALSQDSIAGFDPREDRRREAHEKYGLQTFGTIEEALEKFKPNALIISVPPDIHHHYMMMAAENSISFFVEAGVLTTNRERIVELCKKNKVHGVPSLTLAFHPAVAIVKKLLDEKKVGKISNIMYHCGSYLPEWHTYEHVRDYYVSNPLTGGCREIVAFELSLIAHLFGLPRRVCGNARKTIEIEGAEEIDDTYNFLMDFQEYLATVTVDVTSRHAVRRLSLIGSETQLYWDWNEAGVEVFQPEEKQWDFIPHEEPEAHPGYNANIGEQMYIDELNSFIKTLEGSGEFPNSLDEDTAILELLYAIEESDKTSTFTTVANLT